jgi:hypothetical protein
MHDPRTPEILAWVEAMPLVERLTVMHAMTFVFPRPNVEGADGSDTGRAEAHCR